MFRQQQHSDTFIVPEPVSGSSSSNAKKRDGKPFVIVPEAMVIAEDKLEPHWRFAIDAATD